MGNLHTDEIGVQAGDVLAGKYRVDRVLGEGGMGVVVAAHHIQLDERVALKFLQKDALENPEAVGRFVREAQAAVKIKSEHVARVIDVGTLENGAPYIVMEYLEGQDLDGWLEQRGALSLEQAVEFLLQACEAIAEAHALGIVHRDLKPANLFCVRRADGVLSVKVLDFGISKVTSTAVSKKDGGMTRTNAVLGSPFYMSPEQMRSSRDVDPRGDIWSLGVILYQLVTGRMPFEAEAMPELVLKIADGTPPSMRTYRPELPPAFEAVVMRCLEKDRARRFANVGELATALVEYGPPRSRASVDRVMRTMQAAGLAPSAGPTSADAPGASSDPGAPRRIAAITPPASTQHVNAWGKTLARPGSSRRTVMVAGGALVLALLAVGGGRLLLTRAPAGGAPSDTVPLASASAPAAPSTLEPTPSATVADPVASSTSASVPPSPSAVVVTHTPSSVRASGKAPSPQTSAVPHPTSTTSPAKNCTPPYFIDAVGHRQYKPECL